MWEGTFAGFWMKIFKNNVNVYPNATAKIDKAENMDHERNDKVWFCVQSKGWSQNGKFEAEFNQEIASKSQLVISVGCFSSVRRETREIYFQVKDCEIPKKNVCVQCFNVSMSDQFWSQVFVSYVLQN